MVSSTCKKVIFLALLFPASGFLRHDVDRRCRQVPSTISLASLDTLGTRRDEIKTRLLELIASTPSNLPTSKSLTNEILDMVRKMEATCPTPNDEVVERLGGNWELLWTAQDQTSDEWGLGPLRTWIKYVLHRVSLQQIFYLANLILHG